MRHFLPLLILAYSATAADMIGTIARIESGSNPRAIGDGGRARGAWQMHRAAWDDTCRRLGVRWPHSSAHDPQRSRIVAAAYLAHIRAEFRSMTGRNATPADSYALWNLGVEGYRRRGFSVNNTPRTTRKAAARSNP